MPLLLGGRPHHPHPALGRIPRGKRAVLPTNHGRGESDANGALFWPARDTRAANTFSGPQRGAFFADRAALPGRTTDCPGRRQRPPTPAPSQPC
jgi:hypothetical protein